jgi:hypothetical protein
MDKLLKELTALRAAEQAGQVQTRLFLPESTKQRGQDVKKAIADKTGMPIHYSTVIVLAIRRGLAELETEYITNQNQEDE